MSKFNYIVSTDSGKAAKDATDYLNLIDKVNGKENGHFFSEDVKYFFSNNKTIELVNKNNWDDVFEWWRKLLPSEGRYDWIYDLLADFLCLVGIKFWEYFTKDIDYYKKLDGFWLAGIREVKDE